LDRIIKQIPHNEVPNYIHNIDIIVCYSTAEGTPNQILEVQVVADAGYQPTLVW